MADESGSLAWRIYYADGSRIDSAQTLVHKVPKTGVIAIVQPDSELGRTVLQRMDFYWWEDNEFWGGDIFGLWDYLTRPGNKLVLFGRSIPNAAYREIVQRAIHDPDFKPR